MPLMGWTPGSASVLETISVESSKLKSKENRLRKREQNIQELGDNWKRCNIHLVGIPEGKKRKNHTEIFEEMV